MDARNISLVGKLTLDAIPFAQELLDLGEKLEDRVEFKGDSKLSLHLFTQPRYQLLGYLRWQQPPNPFRRLSEYREIYPQASWETPPNHKSAKGGLQIASSQRQFVLGLEVYFDFLKSQERASLVSVTGAGLLIETRW